MDHKDLEYGDCEDPEEQRITNDQIRNEKYRCSKFIDACKCMVLIMLFIAALMSFIVGTIMFVDACRPIYECSDPTTRLVDTDITKYCIDQQGLMEPVDVTYDEIKCNNQGKTGKYMIIIFLFIGVTTGVAGHCHINHLNIKYNLLQEIEIQKSESEIRRYKAQNQSLSLSQDQSKNVEYVVVDDIVDEC